MPHKITSVIEIETTRGCDMQRKDKHHKQRAKADDSATISDKLADGGDKYTSTATSHRNRLFHNVKNANAGVTQNVNVSVNVEKEDDCMTSCFSALGACFGKAAKSGAG